MSSRHLAIIETDHLVKGLNFSVTSKTLPNKDIIATNENAVNDLEKDDADTICAKISLTLQNFKLPKDTSPRINANPWKNYSLIHQL